MNPQTGASLMELLVVLSIAAILTTLALAVFRSSTNNFKRQNFARELKVDLERARFDSVKRKADVCDEMSRVTITNATTFSVSTDLNQNGRLDLPAETRTVIIPSGSNVQIVGNGITLPVTVRFNERGHALLYSDCASAPTANIPLFFICEGTCTSATANVQNSNEIFVSPTGTVAMMEGGEAMPTFANPTVSNINATSQINPRLSEWIPTTPTPTPTPTATPAPPTPTPTPTPRFCNTTQPYEKPADTGCTCMAPQWVRGSGKCQ